MEPWTSILLAILGNTALLAVLGFLARSLIEKVLARDAKRFETELKAKADATIEQLKSDLQIRNAEHQVRFTKLHEKRAEVIAVLYGKLRKALWDAEAFSSPIQWAGDPDVRTQYVKAFNSLGEAYRYFGEHQIYFPRELCASLETLIGDARQHVIEIGVWTEFGDEPLDNEAQKQKRDAWKAAWNAINSDIPKATRALEDEFRHLLSGDQPTNPVPKSDEKRA